MHPRHLKRAVILGLVLVVIGLTVISLRSRGARAGGAEANWAIPVPHADEAPPSAAWMGEHTQGMPIEEWKKIFDEVGIDHSEDELAEPATSLDAAVSVTYVSPQEGVRQWRHREVLHWLQSPARLTSACREIEDLCREYGYGPWAVAAAYDIAYESSKVERFIQRNADLDPQVMALHVITQRDSVAERAVSHGRRLGIEWNPGFLDRLEQVRVDTFFGHYSPPQAMPLGWPSEFTWEELNGRLPAPSPDDKPE